MKIVFCDIQKTDKNWMAYIFSIFSYHRHDSSVCTQDWQGKVGLPCQNLFTPLTNLISTNVMMHTMVLILRTMNDGSRENVDLHANWQNNFEWDALNPSQESRDIRCVHLGSHDFSSTTCPNNNHILEISEDPCWKVKKVWVVGVLAGGETVRFMKEIKGCWGASRAGGEGTFAKMQWLNVVWLASKAKPNQKYFFSGFDGK